MKGSRLGTSLATTTQTSIIESANVSKASNSDTFPDTVNLPSSSAGGGDDHGGRDASKSIKSTDTKRTASSYNFVQKPVLERPRAGHPLTLISFPSTSITSGGFRGNDNHVSGNSSNVCDKLFGRISRKKKLELVQVPQEETTHFPLGDVDHSTSTRDGWISSVDEFSHAAKFFRVPKPSHSAKKLAKPYSILLPSTTMSSFDKLKRNPYLPTGLLTDDGERWNENLPSATSTLSTPQHNIDNKSVNKLKRNKTARSSLGLSKGFSNISIPKQRKPRLLSSSGFSTFSGIGSLNNSNTNKVVNSATTRKLLEGREGQMIEHEPSLNVQVMSSEQHPRKLLSGTGNGEMSMSTLASWKLNERLQVIRSPEEREESPESIRLDRMGLKVFPFIGGGEGPNLKLLSLQSNLISRLENTSPQLNHLVVLDLYDNRLERITGLQGFTSLRVLLLGKNRIRRIEGLETQKRLEILDLHGNQLRYVDNLGVLSALRVLNLAGNHLRSIRNLGPHGLTALTELNLKRNRIRNLDGLAKAPHLKKLLLANNDLQSSSTLLPLRKLIFLQELLLEPNPLCSATVESRNQVLTMLPTISTLDRCTVTDVMRSEARQWQKRKLAEEEERRKEEARLRTVSPTGGPQDSREQAIYQARRRWESVKNFVKNSNSKPTNPSPPPPSKTSIKITTRPTTSGGGVVRSEIDDKFRSQTLFQSQSQNSSKELLEYPGGEVRLNLAQLDLDFDEARESILVSNTTGAAMKEPEDPCPPSMINDLHPAHPKDYVNSNSLPTKQVWEGQVQLSHQQLGLGLTLLEETNRTNTNDISGDATTTPEFCRLSLQNPQMDSSIITNIIKEAESTQSLTPTTCQQSQRGQKFLLHHQHQGDDGVSTGDNIVHVEGTENLTKLEDAKGIEESYSKSNATNISSSEKATRIAVVRPLVRESNLDESNSSHTNVKIDTSFPTNHKNIQPENQWESVPMSHIASDGEIQNNDHGFKESNVYNWNRDQTCFNQSSAVPINREKVSLDNIKGTLETKDEIYSETLNCSNIVNSAEDNSPTIPVIGGSGATLSLSDSDCDKIIKSNKNESTTSSTKSEDIIPKRNILRRSVSTCLMPVEDTEKEVGESCPTFFSPSINKDETQKINMNTDGKTTSTISASDPNIPGTAASTIDGNSSLSCTSLNDNTGNNVTTITSAKISVPLSILSSSSTAIDRINNTFNGGSDVSWRKRKPDLRKLKSASFDGRFPSSFAFAEDLSDDEHYDDDDTCSIITTGSNTTVGTTSDVASPRSKLGFSRKQLFPRTKAQRLKLKERGPRVQSSSSVTSRIKSGYSILESSGSSINGNRHSGDTRKLRRCDSAVAGGLTCSITDSVGGNISSGPLKRQGTDYLVEIDGKVLSIYGQGGLKHTLTGFPGNVTSIVTTAKFHYIAYDSIIPYFGKLRQIYPSLEHFQFRANNVSRLSQLNALSDLQGLSSLHVAKEGNPLSLDCSWVHYASYRLSHWGLQTVNGKEVSSEYRGGQTSSKCFESLGFLALSCLPQTALTPLAKRLHMLHCFCCCSPSSSSDESVRGRNGKSLSNLRSTSPLPPAQQSSSSGNICTSWDDDPVLLDVIGKEALVYCPLSPQRVSLQATATTMEELDQSTSTVEHNDRSKRQNTMNIIVDSGVEILEKLDMLEKVWPSLMADIIQEEILMDFKFMDNYMKKELKKCQDMTTIALHANSNGGGGANKKHHAI